MTELTIRQVAEKTGLSVHTLRYYERAGLTPLIPRAANGHRRYSEKHVGWIVFIARLRSTGMPISQIRRYVDLNAQGDASIAERLVLLESHRIAVQEQIEELSHNLKMIEAKVKRYREYYETQLEREIERDASEPV